MISILKYVLLGMLIYILLIPVLESLSALICQGLEVLKGKLIYQQAIIQQKVDNISQESQQSTVHAIGFSIPNENELVIEEEEDE